MKLMISEKLSKWLLGISVGCFALNYICWNCLNALTYLSMSQARMVTEDILGSVFTSSFVVGLILFPVGLSLCKRTWHYSTKFFVLTGTSFIIAFFMTAVLPVKEVLGGPEYGDSLVERALWSLSVILFLQMTVQSIILAVVHFLTVEKTEGGVPKKWWRGALFGVLALVIWFIGLWGSVSYMDRHFCC
jgi:hypothetical protein